MLSQPFIKTPLNNRTPESSFNYFIGWFLCGNETPSFCLWGLTSETSRSRQRQEHPRRRRVWAVTPG